MAGFEWNETIQELYCKKTERPTGEAVCCSACRFLKGEGASSDYPYPTIWCSETGDDIPPDEIDEELPCPLFEPLEECSYGK